MKCGLQMVAIKSRVAAFLHLASLNSFFFFFCPVKDKGCGISRGVLFGVSDDLK